MRWTLRILGYELFHASRAPAARPVAKRPAPTSDEERFEQIVDGETDLSETIVIAFSERPDGPIVGYDLTGTDDLDYAIAVATKGLFSLVLDCNGSWEAADDWDAGDDEP